MDGIEKTIRFVYSGKSEDWYEFSSEACKFRKRLVLMCYCVEAWKKRV